MGCTDKIAMYTAFRAPTPKTVHRVATKCDPWAPLFDLRMCATALARVRVRSRRPGGIAAGGRGVARCARARSRVCGVLAVGAMLHC